MKKEFSAEVLLDSFAEKALSFSDCLDLSSDSRSSSDLEEFDNDHNLNSHMPLSFTNKGRDLGLPSQN